MTSKKKAKTAIKLKQLPNVDLPLSFLAELGGMNKATLRKWKQLGRIKTYENKDCNSMVSVTEMRRLEKKGDIEIR